MMSSKKNSITTERNHISANTFIKGDVSSDGDFRVDGKLEGTIKIKGRIVIGKQGYVTGSITSSSAEIEGKFSGSLYISDMLSLKSTALVEGDVQIAKLTVEPGAIFNVKCNMKSGTTPKKNA